MAAIIRNIRDIKTSERQVLEHILGQELQENQQLIVNIMNVAPEPDPKLRPAQSMDDWKFVHDGLQS